MLKMRPPNCMLMSLLLMTVKGFTVHGPSAPLVAPLGSSVVLPLYVTNLSLMEGLEVQWRRTDSLTLVHLYQGGEIQPEAQEQDYRDRAHFFTEEIQHRNFSLRLDDVRAEDDGRYTCRVYSGQELGETMVQIKYIEYLLVSGSKQLVSLRDGEDVTLNCSVDSHIIPKHIEKISWWKTDEYEDIPVLLYQNKTFSDLSHKRYRDRVELFTAEIPKGNVSLRLKRVRIEDKGVYMCYVKAGYLRARATVILKQLGFSFYCIAVLVFCVAAGSGAVLLCFLIYCKLKHAAINSTIRGLHFSLVFCPNICMFFAFILWGFTEGSLDETIACSALYILRPIMLIWALSFLKHFQYYHKGWISFCKIEREASLFTIVVYSVLFTYGWFVYGHNYLIQPYIFSGIGFGHVVVFCVMFFFLRGSFDYLGLNALGASQIVQLTSVFGLPYKVDLCHEIMFMFGAVGLVLLNSVTLTADLILKALKIVTAGVTQNQRNSAQRSDLGRTDNEEEMETLSTADGPDSHKL